MDPQGPPVVLRSAGADDLDVVMALERAGFVPGIVEEAEVFARRIAAFPEGFLLAIDAEGAWGYLCAELWSGVGGDPLEAERFDLGHDIGRWLDRAGQTLYIASMTVTPTRRGGGWGRALFRAGVEALTTRFPAVDRVVLIVNEHWEPARRIYRAEGFVETGRLEGFFRPEAGPVGAAVVMERRTLRGR